MPYLQKNASLISRCTDARFLRQCLPEVSEQDLSVVLDYLLFLARRNYAPTTLRHFITVCASFLRAVNGASLTNATHRDVEHFIEQRQDQGIHPATINCQLSSLSSFYRHLLDLGDLNRSPILRRHHLQVPDQLPRAMSQPEYHRFLSVITRPRDRAIFLLLLRTGIRIGELVDLTVDNLRLADQELVIPIGGKNRRGRIVYFSPDAGEALAAYLRQRPQAPSPALFLSNRRQPLTTRMIQYLFTNYAHKAKLQLPRSPHCLRHTFATELLNVGADLVTIQYLLGHDRIQVTQRYARLSDEKKRSVYFSAMTEIEKTEPTGGASCGLSRKSSISAVI